MHETQQALNCIAGFLGRKRRFLVFGRLQGAKDPQAVSRCAGQHRVLGLPSKNPLGHMSAILGTVILWAARSQWDVTPLVEAEISARN